MADPGLMAQGVVGPVTMAKGMESKHALGFCDGMHGPGLCRSHCRSGWLPDQFWERGPMALPQSSHKAGHAGCPSVIFPRTPLPL